ncbi:MAG: nitronate monooxygenase [Lachnospiraceae bacterium]|nr:nitronate monooxygenase [Lachnospiraceae bacterium]MEE1257928.1 nitronate monooxygenase family protein [Lachnospiraceae bacterium]
MKVKELKIGDLCAKIPVVQGGMGVGVSLSKLAGAVASAGGVGVISTAQIGFRDPKFKTNPIETNLKAIGEEIAKARKLASGGVLGVNIMVATRRYEDYVKAAVEAGIDLIISGAGLPMTLPALVEGAKTKIAPIVSSAKSLNVITKYWMKKYNRKPDMVVVEGPAAGGHLGFSREEIENYSRDTYDEEIKAILSITKEMEVPLVVAGGIYDKEDMEHYLSMGASGVQLATRFVTTEECDASDAYKQAYINAKKEDIVIVSSPVGMPGRAIHNAFLDKVNAGERFMRGCRQCISTCKPATAPYCITEALINAVEGRLDEGLIFCGSNAYRADKIERVADIMEEFA